MMPMAKESETIEILWWLGEFIPSPSTASRRSFVHPTAAAQAGAAATRWWWWWKEGKRHHQSLIRSILLSYHPTSDSLISFSSHAEWSGVGTGDGSDGERDDVGGDDDGAAQHV